MTSNSTAGMTDDQIVEAGLAAANRLRDQIARIKRARDAQPDSLAKARSDADEARGWAVIEDPWDELVSALPMADVDGRRTGDAIALPSLTAKELMGARLAFDLLDCGEDLDQIEEVQTRYFHELHGDTGVLFLVAFAALSTIASVVVPQMLNEIETQASNYDARVMLAEARAKAWRGRVKEFDADDAE